MSDKDISNLGKDKIIDRGSITKKILNLYGAEAGFLVTLITGIVSTPIMIAVISILYNIIFPNNCSQQGDPTAEYICTGFHGLLSIPVVLILIVVTIVFRGNIGQKFINWTYRNYILFKETPNCWYELYYNKLLIKGYKGDILISFEESSGDVEFKTFKISKLQIKGYLINLKNYAKYKDIIKIIGSNYLFLTSNRDLKIDIRRNNINELKKSFYKKDGLLYLSQ